MDGNIRFWEELPSCNSISPGIVICWNKYIYFVIHIFPTLFNHAEDRLQTQLLFINVRKEQRIETSSFSSRIPTRIRKTGKCIFQSGNFKHTGKSHEILHKFSCYFFICDLNFRKFLFQNIFVIIHWFWI